jgi:sulfite reductase (NADPH) hemoprotein beta-component
LGGSSENNAAIGERLGPSVAKDQVTLAIVTILNVYVKLRLEDESFLDMVNRVGITPFKEQVYANH